MKTRYVLLGVALVLSSPISLPAAVMSDGAPNSNETDLVMWLKADSLALSNGANVTQWNDSSNKGRHMYGGFSGAGYPTFQTGVLGGLPCVRFNNTLKDMSNGNGANAVVLNQEHTFIVVAHAKKAGPGAGNDPLLSYAPYTNGGVHQTTSTELIVYQAGSARAFRMRYPGLDTQFSATNSQFNNPTIYAQVRSNSTNARAYANGAVPAWLSYTSATTDFSTVNQVFRLGEHSSASQYLDGDLFEVLVYNRALSVLELQEVYDYLNAKWMGLPNRPGSVVFQADFNGSGSGTGGASDVVTVGGTGATFTDAGANLTPSITALFSPFPNTSSYLQLADTNGTAGTANAAAGVRFTPTGASTSPDSWYFNRGSYGFDLLDGGLDFLVQTTVASSSWVADTVYPLDIDGGANGLRLILKSTAANTLSFQLQAKNGANTAVHNLQANATVNMPAGIYHMGLTAQTDAAGVVTIRLFVQPDNSTLSTAAPQASAVTSGALDAAGTNVINHAFTSTPNFRFGQMNNPAGSVIHRFDRFRIYRGVPQAFEPFEFFPDMVQTAGVTKPNPEPTLPAGFDAFAPPVSGSPVANTPTFAEWTRTGTAGDTLVATGDKLSTFTSTDEGKDTRLVTYGQAPQGLLTSSANLYRLDGNKVAFGLDPGLPKGTMYFVWPKNANGYGRPVAVNQTDAWWIGPKEATRGETIAVYGRNLSHDNGTSTAWIYAKPLTGGGSAGFITPTAVNPYKVDFVVPAGFTNGTYEIWAHNGHGRSYGWSGPLTLTVNDGFTWTGGTVNVSTYGAIPNDANDDTTAINNAISAAATNGTVSFAAGTYRINTRVDIKSNVRMLGAGKGAGGTEILLTTNGGGAMWFFNLVSNIEVSDMLLNTGSVTGNVYALNGAANNLLIKNVNVTALGATHWIGQLTKGNGAHGNRNIVQDCDFTGTTLQFIGCTQLFVDRCNIRARNDRDCLYATNGCQDMSITHCTGKDDDNTTTTGWSNGRFCYCGINADYPERHFYWGENKTTDLGVRAAAGGGGQLNQGEQLSFDGGVGKFAGTPSSVTSTTATFSSLPGAINGKDCVAVVVDGKGYGQIRAATVSSNTITVSPAWNVTPDTSTSVIAIGYYSHRVVAYRNLLDGKASWIGGTLAESASTGIAWYFGVLDTVADLNLITECEKGIATSGKGDAAAIANMLPSLSHLVANNLIQNSDIGFYSTSGNNGTYASASFSANQVVRGNTIAAAPLALYLLDGSNNTYSLDTVVFDRTFATDTEKAITTGANSANWLGNVIAVGNYCDRGTATLTQSRGTNINTTLAKVGLFGNTLLNFQTQYFTVPTAAPLVELPQRVISVTGKAGGSSQTATFTVQNAGTADLTWDKTLVGSWLSVSPAPGTSSNATKDGGKTTITVTCNPAALTANTYTGTINAQEAGVTKKVATVIFTVTP